MKGGIDDLVPADVRVSDPYELAHLSVSDLTLLRNLVTVEIARRTRAVALDDHEHARVVTFPRQVIDLHGAGGAR